MSGIAWHWETKDSRSALNYTANVNGCAEKPVTSAPDATESYISPNEPQACGITQASSGFDRFYFSAETGE